MPIIISCRFPLRLKTTVPGPSSISLKLEGMNGNGLSPYDISRSVARSPGHLNCFAPVAKHFTAVFQLERLETIVTVC